MQLWGIDIVGGIRLVNPVTGELREAKIVTTRREAESIFYSLADTRAARVLEVLAELFCKSDTAQAKRGRKN